MQIENVTRISLSSRGTTNQQRQCTISHCMLGQVIINDEGIFTLTHEIFSNGTARIRSNVLHGSHFAGGSTHNHSIIHGTVLFQSVYQLSNGGLFLADGHINAEHTLALLVDDGIGSNHSLTGLAVANNQFTLTAANRNHAVNCFDTGLKRHRNALALDDAGSWALDGAILLCINGTLTVDGLAQSIHNAANHGLAYRNAHNLAGTLHNAALFQANVTAQQNNGNAVLFQVLCHTVCAVLKLHQLTAHAVFKTHSAGNAVTDQNNGTSLILTDGVFVILDLGLDEF
ncbi:hypothetical protein EVA_04658 [gut metagenome]|uniref:Uncharacterized protein n=1 Tax=gut metagenome TaxID=749906 RepID=J9H1E3_9ZZZZ